MERWWQTQIASYGLKNWFYELMWKHIWKKKGSSCSIHGSGKIVIKLRAINFV